MIVQRKSYMNGQIDRSREQFQELNIFHEEQKYIKP